MTIETSVIIPVLDQWTLTEACLRALAAHSPDTIEVIVIDNGSRDETPQTCPVLGNELFPHRFSFLHQETNLNFGPASNLGARRACGAFLFFLNNDTQVRPNWLPPLCNSLANPKIGAAGPCLLYPNGRVQHVGIAFTPGMTPCHLFENFPGDHTAVRRKRRCQAITAAALLLPKQLFADIGGFFEEFRNGSEDLDLCARIRARGLQLIVNPDSVVIHHTSQSAGRFDHDNENAVLLRSRQAQAFAPDLYLFARQAGYRLQLTPWLTPFMEPINRTLHEKNGPTGMEDLRQALMSEPLWEEGYDLLVTTALAKDNHAQALEGMFLRSFFFPNIEHHRQLQQFARRLGKQALAMDTARTIQIIENTLLDRQRLAETARTLATRFRNEGNQECHALYQDWIKIFDLSSNL